MRWRIDAEVRAALERERAAAGARERSGSTALAELERRVAGAEEQARASAREASEARTALEASGAEAENLRAALEGLSHEASAASRLREQLRAAKEAAAIARAEAAAAKEAAEVARIEAEEAKKNEEAKGGPGAGAEGGTAASSSSPLELRRRLEDLETEASTLRRSLAEALRRLSAAEKRARASVDGAAVRRALAALLGPRRSGSGTGGRESTSSFPEALEALCAAAGVDEETKEGYLLNSARGLMLFSSSSPGAEDGGSSGNGGGRKRGALRAAAAAPVALARGAGRLVLGAAGGRPVPPARPPPEGAGLTDSWVDYLIAQQEDSPSKVPVVSMAVVAAEVEGENEVK